MSASPKNKTWLWTLLLLVFVGAVFLPGLRGGFVNDDRKLIESRAPLLATPTACRVLPLKVYWWGTAYDPDAWRYYRPWVSLTYWLEYRLGGLKPSVYHLSNWVVHLANTALVFVVMRSLVGLGLAAGIAALAAVCPAALTSVGWISGRTDLWATFFVLLFFLAFRAARRAKNAWPHVAASAAFLGALASKEVAIVAPVVAWALDRCSPESARVKQAPRRPIWHYFPLVIPLGIYLVLRRVASGEVVPPSVSIVTLLRGVPFLAEQYLRSAVSVLLPLHYNFFSGLTWSLPAQRGVGFYLGWLLFLLLIASVVLGLRKRQLWAAGGLWFGLVLFPAYGLNRSFAPVADLYAYLALPGFWLFVLDGLRALASVVRREEFARRGLRLAVVPVAVVFAILTVNRLPILATDLALWSHMARRAPSFEPVVTNLSEAYQSHGDEEQAYYWSLKAAALDSAAWMPHNNLAVYYLDRLDIYSAAPHVDALAELAPNRFEAQVTIARFFYLADHCSAAVGTYQRAFRLGPPTAEALFGYGNALMGVEEYSAALGAYSGALELKPGWAAVYNNLGLCFENMGELDQAIAAQKEALRLDPELNVSRESLAILYVMKNDSAEARRAAQEFMAHDPAPQRVERLKELMVAAMMDTTFFSKEGDTE